MHFDEFETNLKRLAEWFNKNLNRTQVSMWFERCDQVAEEPFSWCVERWIDTQKYMPTPQQLLDLMRDYWNAHPQKRTKEEREWKLCEECGDKGYFDVFYREGEDSEGNELWYGMGVPCAKCDNWKRSGIFPANVRRFWTKEEIERKGWVFENPMVERWNKAETRPIRSVAKLTDRAVKPIEKLEVDREVERKRQEELINQMIQVKTEMAVEAQEESVVPDWVTDDDIPF